MNRIALLLTGVPDLMPGGSEAWCVSDEVRIPALRALAARGAAFASEWAAGPSGALELFGLPQPCGAASVVLAAIGYGVPLEGVELLLRCDLVTTADGLVVDRLDGKMTDQEGRLLIAALDQRLGNDILRFYPGSQQRHFLVVRDLRALGVEGEPEGIVPDRWAGISRSALRDRRRREAHPLVRALTDLLPRAAEVLADHEVNHVRLDLHENPANDLWIGDGVRPSVLSVSSPVSFDTIVTTADYLVGLAKVLDIQVVAGHRRRDAAESLRADAATVQRLLISTDRLLVHVDLAPWVAGAAGKRVRLLEQTDRLVVAALQRRLERSHDARLAIVLLGSAMRSSTERERERCRCQVVVVGGEPPRRVAEVLPWLCRSSG